MGTCTSGEVEPAGRWCCQDRTEDAVRHAREVGSVIFGAWHQRGLSKVNRGLGMNGCDGELRLIVPAVPVVAGPLPAGTPLLAQSGVFTVKVV